MRTYSLEFFSAPYDPDFWRDLSASKAKALAMRARQAGCVPVGNDHKHGVPINWRGPDLGTIALRLRGGTGPKRIYRHGARHA